MFEKIQGFIRRNQNETVVCRNSNWDLYYEEKLNCVMSIAKKTTREQGCKDSIFGGLDYTRRYLKEEIRRKKSCAES